MEIVAGEQGLSNNFFHTNLLTIRHKISFFNVRGFKLGHFDFFERLFPFLAFLKLQPIILGKEGHVMA